MVHSVFKYIKNFKIKFINLNLKNYSEQAFLTQKSRELKFQIKMSKLIQQTFR